MTLAKIAAPPPGNDAKPDFGWRSRANRDCDQFVTRDVRIAAQRSWLFPNRPHQLRDAKPGETTREYPNLSREMKMNRRASPT